MIETLRDKQEKHVGLKTKYADKCFRESLDARDWSLSEREARPVTVELLKSMLGVGTSGAEGVP
jgi:hypothetical protein